MGFVQFYFGLPLAMIVIGFVFIPLYYKWNVYTAYEFIGKRFDNRARLFTAGLFLLSRGLAAGITIYAPSIILSKILDWPLSWTCVFIGGLVIIYTTTGGAKAVGVTHKQQMVVMFLGIFLAFGLTIHYLAPIMDFGESLALAGSVGKMNIIDTSWDPTTKYTLWSGLIGGFFLQLSYFGTDQSQVQRYLSGKNAAQARQGLWMNAVLKIPMQFFILLTGVLVFVFFMVNASPLHWNEANVIALENSDGKERYEELDKEHRAVDREMRSSAIAYVEALRAGENDSRAQATDKLNASIREQKQLQEETKKLLGTVAPENEPNDKDYIFISYIMQHFPVGVIGLLLAMIFSAGMSSTSAELSALATTSVVDVFRRERSDEEQVKSTRQATIVFGLLALGFAAVFSLFENLIQAVNILGSLFYGSILGIFLVAFFMKWIQGTAVFWAAIIAQLLIFYLFFADIEIAFLWYNLIAPTIVLVLAPIIQIMLPNEKAPPAGGAFDRSYE
jgi:Na+/proline symporter